MQDTTLRLEKSPREPYTVRYGERVEFSPGGRYVATLGRHEHKVWEVKTGKLVFRSNIASYLDDSPTSYNMARPPFSFVNDVVIFDGETSVGNMSRSPVLVDLENNLGEEAAMMTSIDISNPGFLPIDSEHFIRFDIFSISLYNRKAKKELWRVDAKKVPNVHGQNPRIGSVVWDETSNRVWFCWSDFPQKGKQAERIASLAMDGLDYRLEYEEKPTLHRLQLLPSGDYLVKVPIKFDMATTNKINKEPLIVVNLRKKRQIILPEGIGYYVFDGFLPENRFSLSRQQEDGLIETIQCDLATGKIIQKTTVQGVPRWASFPFAWSPDRQTMAVMRQARDKSFNTVSLYDGRGKWLMDLDDTQQTIAFDQTQNALASRAKAFEAASQEAWSDYLRQERGKRVEEARKQRPSEAELQKQKKQAEMDDPRSYVTCSFCKGKGAYRFENNHSVGESYTSVAPRYDLTGKMVVGPQYGVHSSAMEGSKDTWACPCCHGAGKVKRR
ncbi:hypothetical protein [Armatimonas sp.]|uniref:hypothetical protein n=1 Tax=Armatimonas sp. TaxID=1872638 RepID=UPI00375139C4